MTALLPTRVLIGIFCFLKWKAQQIFWKRDWVFVATFIINITPISKYSVFDPLVGQCYWILYQQGYLTPILAWLMVNLVKFRKIQSRNGFYSRQR